VLSRFRAETERGLGDSILTVLTQTLDDHLGPRWEDMLRQHVRPLAAAGELGKGIVGVGGWWSDDSDGVVVGYNVVLTALPARAFTRPRR
jgi:hypothetical protein